MSSIVYTNIIYGFHLMKERTLAETVRCVPDCLSAFQIYIASSRSYKPPKASVEDILLARDILAKRDLWMCIHGCLLYNPAGKVTGPTDEKYAWALEATREGLATELDIGAGLGCGVVVHIGSAKDRELGLKVIAETVVDVLRRDTGMTEGMAEGLGVTKKKLKRQRKVILENSASEGNKLGGTLEDIRVIISYIPKRYRRQVKICIDTAHAFGAGQWDWGIPSEIDRFYDEFEESIGPVEDYLEVFHLNDSRRSESKGKNAYFGSRKDRHELLGLGYIFDNKSKTRFRKSLMHFISQARERGIPLISETPGVHEDGSASLGGLADLITVQTFIGCGVRERP